MEAATGRVSATLADERQERARRLHAEVRDIAAAGGNEVRRLLAEQMVGEGDEETISFEGHRGEPVESIDANMNLWLRRRVEATGAQYLSEETRSALNLRPGAVVAYADPLDGTGLARATFGGWAVVVVVDIVRAGRRTAHTAGAIAAGNGALVSWWCVGRRGEVWLEFAGPFAWNEDPDVKGGAVRVVVPADDDEFPERRTALPRADRLAAVAWTPARRRRLAAEYDLEHASLSLKNTAGNPDVMGLLRGDLGAVVEVDRVELHDAAYLLPLALLGGHVISPEGDEIDVFRHFERLEPGTRHIGPFVAGRNPAAIAAVLAGRRRD